MQSPDAASLGRCGEVSVSHYNGKPKISFDLLSVRTGKFTYPVTLHCDAAGTKPDQHPGSLGLNFSLTTAGAVYRVVNGHPDDFLMPLGRGYNFTPARNCNLYRTTFIIQKFITTNQ